ncbi:MAG TPA: uroporphyrinogen-III synthase [Terriglobales bacterium]|jgi:uroporphyrinogen-III synthase|nr:uroporphyrinogen-III synthase [Terriglobales bacterium]
MNAAIKSRTTASPSGKPSGATPELPLQGLQVVVGRARHQASALSSALRTQGASVLEIPFIEIRQPGSYRALDSALRNLPSYDWLILTSVNGVDAFWKRLRRLRLQKRNLAKVKIAAIGPATKRAIEEHGLKVTVMPDEYVAESVVASLRQKVKGNRVLLARAKVARDVIPRELSKLGAQVDVVEAYETIIPRASAKRLREALGRAERRPAVITFTSSSTARNFVALLGKPRGRGRPRHASKRMLEKVQFASIGPVTSSTLRGLGLPVDIEAREYTIPGLVEAIVAYHKKPC